MLESTQSSSHTIESQAILRTPEEQSDSEKVVPILAQSYCAARTQRAIQKPAQNKRPAMQEHIRFISYPIS